MGRAPYRPPTPRRLSGRIGFATPDGVFLGAKDIIDYVPLEVRIAEVVEYPAGTVRGGHRVTAPFLAIIYEAQARNGAWVRAKKPLPLNGTNHIALYRRFGENAEWWEGMTITLVLEPTRNPSGGAMVYGIRIAPESDEQTEEQLAAKMRRAVAHECPYERQPGEDREQPEDHDQRADEPQDQEPPEDWEGSVPADE